MLNELELAKNAACETAKLLKSNYLNDIGVITDKDKDIKTQADLAAHEYLLETLGKTGIKIISEEASNYQFNINDYQWIIDPLDGTLNFSRGFCMAAVSIALWNNGSPLLGVVHNIFSNQTFYSSFNNGAWLDNNKLSVSKITCNKDAVIATGVSSGGNFSDKALREFVTNIQKYKKIRMLGSASLMLAYVACGHFDLYKEDDIYIWDVAAGLSLVVEAGGSYDYNLTKSPVKFNIRATNSYLVD